MGCACKNNGSTAKVSKFTVRASSGETRTFTSEADARLYAAKHDGKIIRRQT